MYCLIPMYACITPTRRAGKEKSPSHHPDCPVDNTSPFPIPTVICLLFGWVAIAWLPSSKEARELHLDFTWGVLHHWIKLKLVFVPLPSELLQRQSSFLFKYWDVLSWAMFTSRFNSSIDTENFSSLFAVDFRISHMNWSSFSSIVVAKRS